MSHTHQAKRLPECRGAKVGGGWVSVARGPVPIGHTLSRDALCQGDARFTGEPSARGRSCRRVNLRVYPGWSTTWVSFGRRARFFVAPRSSRSQKADTEVCPYTKPLPQFRQLTALTPGKLGKLVANPPYPAGRSDSTRGVNARAISTSGRCMGTAPHAYRRSSFEHMVA